MKRIDSAVYEANKIEGNGKLKYQLWVDSGGKLYVRIEDNAAAGTFSGLLFSTADYAAYRNAASSIGQPHGYDLSENKVKQSANMNDGAFLKAVLRHLLPE